MSPALHRLVLLAEVVAPCLVLASIEGEPGTGKHHFAQILHQRSPFATADFHHRDARKWLATDTDIPPSTGTLYLDRVDLLPPCGQSLLLSFVKAVHSDSPIPPRFLLLTSSHASLRQLASQRQFLPDLAYRLSAVHFCLPPLREHREDIAPLTQSILERLCHRYQQPVASLGPGSLQHLQQHAWPGNVRELACVLESAILESPSGILHPASLNLISPQSPLPHPSESCESAIPLTLDAAIRRHIQLVLNHNRGNKLRAAKQLGISRSTLYRILAGDSLNSESALLR